MRKRNPISFDDLLVELKEQKAGKDDTANMALDKLFSESFMSKHSSFKSFQEFLEKGNFQAWTQDDLAYIQGELLDRHVARETEFADWQSMLDTAKSSV